MCVDGVDEVNALYSEATRANGPISLPFLVKGSVEVQLLENLLRSLNCFMSHSVNVQNSYGCFYDLPRVSV